MSVQVLQQRPMASRWLVTVRRTRNRSFAWLLFSLAVVLTFADFSEDYASVGGITGWRHLVPQLRSVTAPIIGGLILILIALGMFRLTFGRSTFRRTPLLNAFFFLYAAATLMGICVGLYKHVPPRFVLGDAQNALVYFVPFALRATDGTRDIRYLRRLFFVACSFVILKLIISLIFDLVLANPLSGRHLFKASFFFAAQVCLGLSMFLFSPRGKRQLVYALVLGSGLIGMIMAQMRGYFMGTMVGVAAALLLSIDFRRSIRIAAVTMLIVAVAVGVAVFVEKDITRTFGDWNSAQFQTGADFRSRQVKMLYNMFRGNWMVGAGLGAFDPTWEGYDPDLPRPYLVELEYFNLLAKLGVIGFTLLSAAFCCLVAECIRLGFALKPGEIKGTIIGMTAGLIALAAQSLTNTGYSSVIFHLYVAMLLLVASSVIALRRTITLVTPAHSGERKAIALG